MLARARVPPRHVGAYNARPTRGRSNSRTVIALVELGGREVVAAGSQYPIPETTCLGLVYLHS